MQNLKIFLEDIVRYAPEKVGEFGVSEEEANTFYQKVMNMVGGEDKFSDFLMGFLNLLYEDFDMYFFKRFTEPSLLYHISIKEADLKKLIEDFYAGKVEIGPKDFYLSKLKGYEKEKVLKVLETFITLGNLAPEVYRRYEKESILDEREKEINKRYPTVRHIKKIEIAKIKRTEEKETKKERSSFAVPTFILGIFFLAGIAIISVVAKLIVSITKVLKR